MTDLKLTKNQVAIFTGLAMQRAELQKKFQNIISAENEQIALLVKHNGLEEGDYQVIQEEDDIYLRLIETQD